MELEKLILLNKHIKRRLIPFFRKEVCNFKDGRNRIDEAAPIGMPHAISIPNVENPWPKNEIFEKAPYFVEYDVKNENIRGHITEKEARIVLGVDWFADAAPRDIHAMLGACMDGPGLSNAYVLGGDYSFGEMKKPPKGLWLVVPVQYYSIPKDIFDFLALSKREIRKF